MFGLVQKIKTNRQHRWIDLLFLDLNCFMKAANIERAMVRPGSHLWPNRGSLPDTRFVSASGNQTDTNDIITEQFMGVTVSLLTGLFALWVSLTILSLIGLRNVDGGFLASLNVRITVASALALTLCFVGLPLIIPWLVAFFPAYFLIPSKSVLWKPWVCTFSGILVGVLALWIDAVVYSQFTGGSLSLLNVPVLKLASIPAAVLGGAICFAAAAGARVFKAVLSSIPAASATRPCVKRIQKSI
jgi:hypothetical protein